MVIKAVTPRGKLAMDDALVPWIFTIWTILALDSGILVISGVV
jgi:hypothetical protein